MNVFPLNRHAMITSLKTGGHKDSSAEDVNIENTGKVPGGSTSVVTVSTNIHSQPVPYCTAAKSPCGAGLKQCGGSPHANPALMPSPWKNCWALEAIAPHGCWLHKLRSCTICTERKKLSGTVEVDEFYLGGQHPGKRGRGAEHKSVIVAAAEKKGRKLGRIRLQVSNDCSSNSIDPFMLKNIDQKSLVITDGWSSYKPVEKKGYNHQRVLQTKAEDKSSVLPGINLIASLFKRLVIGTFHGRCDRKHLQPYLDEYVFRFNRRTTKYVGKRFMRIIEQVVVTRPITYSMVFQPVSVTQ